MQRALLVTKWKINTNSERKVENESRLSKRKPSNLPKARFYIKPGVDLSNPLSQSVTNTHTAAFSSALLTLTQLASFIRQSMGIVHVLSNRGF